VRPRHRLPAQLRDARVLFTRSVAHDATTVDHVRATDRRTSGCTRRSDRASRADISSSPPRIRRCSASSLAVFSRRRLEIAGIECSGPLHLKDAVPRQRQAFSWPPWVGWDSAAPCDRGRCIACSRPAGSRSQATAMSIAKPTLLFGNELSTGWCAQFRDTSLSLRAPRSVRSPAFALLFRPVARCPWLAIKPTLRPDEADSDATPLFLSPRCSHARGASVRMALRRAGVSFHAKEWSRCCADGRSRY
jgi:hypothetical protein